MDGGIQFEGNSGLARLLHIAAFFGHKEAPDTTELSYDRLLGVIESSLSLGELTLRGNLPCGSPRPRTGRTIQVMSGVPTGISYQTSR